MKKLICLFCKKQIQINDEKQLLAIRETNEPKVKEAGVVHIDCFKNFLKWNSKDIILNLTEVLK
jgi:hypothetical protein